MEARRAHIVSICVDLLAAHFNNLANGVVHRIGVMIFEVVTYAFESKEVPVFRQRQVVCLQEVVQIRNRVLGRVLVQIVKERGEVLHRLFLIDQRQDLGVHLRTDQLAPVQDVRTAFNRQVTFRPRFDGVSGIGVFAYEIAALKLQRPPKEFPRRRRLVQGECLPVLE